MYNDKFFDCNCYKILFEVQTERLVCFVVLMLFYTLFKDCIYIILLYKHLSSKFSY